MQQKLNLDNKMHSASVQVELSVTILEENIAEVNNKHLGLVKLGSCFCSLRTVDETTAERCFERPFAVIANELTSLFLRMQERSFSSAHNIRSVHHSVLLTSRAVCEM